MCSSNLILGCAELWRNARKWSPSPCRKARLKYGSWFTVFCAVIHPTLPLSNKWLGIRWSSVSLRNINELYRQISYFVLGTKTTSPQESPKVELKRTNTLHLWSTNHPSPAIRPGAKWVKLPAKRLYGCEENVCHLKLLKLPDPGSVDCAVGVQVLR